MINLKKTIGIAFLGMLSTICFSQENAFNYSWKGYPETAKTPSQTKLLIERKVPKTVRPKQSYTYEIIVTNRSYYKLDEIVLVENLPAGFNMTKTSPKPDKTRGSSLMWNFGLMAPGQKEVITITGSAAKPGKLVHRGNADLNFNLGQMNAIMEVINPSLLFTIEAKEDVIISEEFVAKMTFKNNGTATVRGAILQHALSGIATINGKSNIKIDIGNLEPGDVKSHPVKFKAIKTGKFKNNFVVKAEDGVSDTAVMNTTVKQPKLAIKASAPKMRYVGNNVVYDIAIKNSGDGVAKNLSAKLDLPNGVKITSADEGGKPVGSTVMWKLGSLPPGATKEISAVVKGMRIMKLNAKVEAEAFAATPVSTSLTTDVQGIPALLLVVDDDTDPVAVGENVKYLVYVTNTGSLAADNIRVVCKLEPSMRYVSSGGATSGSLKGQEVVFAPLKTLEVGKKAVFEVTVKALKNGDVRFGADVSCEQLDGKVTEFESTNFYE
jgi:uncharacterized repeat protein (TIGR01451 family)